MRKWVVSLLSTAAVVVGTMVMVPVALSRDDAAGREQQPVRPEAPARVEPVSARSDAVLQAAQLRAFPLDQTLIARRDGIDFHEAAFVEETLEPRAGGRDNRSDVVSRASAEVQQLGIELPQPGPMSATLATLALGLFFFLRRIV